MSSESTEVWTGWYRDRRGAEAIVITSQGRGVSTRVRGVRYGGGGFAALRAAEEDGGRPLAGCVLEWDLPLPVVHGGTTQQGTLSCLLALGEALPDGSPERVDLQLTLHCGGAAYESGVTGGDFEQALGRILRQLPAGTRFARDLLQAA
ncbi:MULTISPECIES: DUF6304 family protein [Streptomyces]|uniref:Uncharacterized protein n=2 Tax=Streptomyces TaxID=1883 RepID=A0A100Y451_9ACTN|nr:MULTISPECIES: DUF6304 family protein [Streptomyces]KUH37290.1 hypothetical protein ATE80_18940 [Streptomyces kanasensis]UUS32904.1 DUF6304 family protein [Streptomyces changanensis]